MNMQFFQGCHKVEQVKTEYRRQAFIYHPDRGGDLRVMQRLNEEYLLKLASFDGSETNGEGGKTFKYSFKPDVEQGIMDKIGELLALRLGPTVEINLIGTWIWILGDTKPVKDKIKSVGCKWHSKRGCWYWQNDGYKRRYSHKSLGALAAQYGCDKFANDPYKTVQ